jgi:hypothetical protein
VCRLRIRRRGAAHNQISAGSCAIPRPATLLRLLKLDWTFFGLKAPRLAWAGGGGLLLITLLILGWLWLRVLRELRSHERGRGGLEAVLD